MTDKTDFEQLITERPLEPFRLPATDRMSAVVDEVVGQTLEHEERFGLRKRKRKAIDLTNFKKTITAIVCDVSHHYLSGSSGGVYVSLSKQQLGRKSRYKPSLISETLPTILETLSSPELAFIEMVKGNYTRPWIDETDKIRFRRQTSLQAGPMLKNLLKDLRITEADMYLSFSDELIVLRGTKSADGGRAKEIDYEDTADTIRYRAELVKINERIEKANITLKGGGDTRKRKLRRIFNNGSFEEGGRLYGGFWLNMKAKDRLKRIRIDGEEVVELDYGQMHIKSKRPTGHSSAR